MKRIFLLLALGLSLTACKRHDTTLRQQVAGSWTIEKAGKMTIAADGSYSIQGRHIYVGTWQIADGVLVMTHTNAPIPGVERYKIIRVDDHQLIFGEEDGKTITLNR